jgi:hypothetical protein
MRVSYYNIKFKIVSSVSLSTNLNVQGNFIFLSIKKIYFYKISCLGGEIITITGTNFNSSLGQVFFGSVQAASLNFSNTQIIVKSPSMSPGSYSLNIPTGSLGNAR